MKCMYTQLLSVSDDDDDMMYVDDDDDVNSTSK